MKIIPQQNIVYLKMDEAKAGALDTSSRASGVEYGEILALGEGAKNYGGIKVAGGIAGGLKVGDKVFVKSWAVDIITHNEVKYHFVNITSGGILAVIK